MLKENGRRSEMREEKATKDSSAKSKKFKCSVCENSRFINNVEFGEEIFCNCGGVMEEVIKI